MFTSISAAARQIHQTASASGAQEKALRIVLDYVQLQPGEFNFIYVNGRQSQGAPEQTWGGGCKQRGL